MTARPPHLPDPLVRLAPVGLQPVEDLARHRPRVVRRLEALGTGRVQRVDELAVHVELELVGGAVPDPDRLRPFVPGEPRQLDLREPPLAGDAVDGLDVPRRAGDRAEQPVSPGARLVEVPGSQEREQRQRRVPDPAVAVVPVADAAERLGERRRRGSHDPARRRERQRLQREQRPHHGIAPASLHRAVARPLGPVLDGLVERVLRIDRRRGGPRSTGTTSGRTGRAPPRGP